MVEAYLAAVTEQPILRSLRGSLKNADLRAHKRHLAAKYL